MCTIETMESFSKKFHWVFSCEHLWIRISNPEVGKQLAGVTDIDMLADNIDYR